MWLVSFMVISRTEFGILLPLTAYPDYSNHRLPFRAAPIQ